MSSLDKLIQISKAIKPEITIAVVLLYVALAVNLVQSIMILSSKKQTAANKTTATILLVVEVMILVVTLVVSFGLWKGSQQQVGAIASLRQSMSQISPSL